MWSDKKSMLLSKVCTVFFMLVLILTVAAAARYTPYIILVYLPSLRGHDTLFKLTVYSGGVSAAVLLVYLYMLLGKLGRGEVFVRKNVDYLRYISWCCFIGAFIAAISAFYWYAWLAVAVAAAFMGLIVRVIKNVFAKAVSLQDDAELTI